MGIWDKKLSEKLQLEADLTLEKAMNLVRQRETVRKQQESRRESLWTALGENKTECYVQRQDKNGWSKQGKLQRR